MEHASTRLKIVVPLARRAIFMPLYFTTAFSTLFASLLAFH